ncbi:reverse transcriptase domain-containing protein [Tanacetum coccineum]
METRGKKKAVGEPAPPAHDPHDVEMIERLQQRIQELELHQLLPDSPTKEAESEYVNHLYHPHRNDHAVDRDDRYRDDLIRGIGLKIEILEFIGKVHPDDFIDWLSMVERVFDVRDILDKLKVKLVAIKLQKHASLWWDHVNNRRRIKEKSKNMTVEEVINEFDKFRMRCDVVKEEEQNRPPTTPKTTPKATTPTTSTVGVTKERVKNAPRCYKCSGLGHYARDCSNLKTLAFIPDDADPIYDTETEPALDEPGEELVYPNRGEALTQAEGSHLLMKKTDFEGLVKTSPYVFTLVVVEENKIINEAPLQVQSLLKKFADVTPNDIPPGLPAMRDI